MNIQVDLNFLNDELVCSNLAANHSPQLLEHQCRVLAAHVALT